MDKEQLFVYNLRTQGERATSVRLTMFRALIRESPISSVDLVNLLSKQAVDQATTYRNIALFRQLGVITDIVTADKRLLELSDTYGGHHHHFWCTNCGQLIDFDSSIIEEGIKATVGEIGATPKSHQVEIAGTCSLCKLT